MTADQFLNQLKSVLSTLRDWVILIAGFVFSLLFLATALSMAGHPIPYVPAIRANMQEIGVLLAAVGYALWKR